MIRIVEVQTYTSADTSINKTKLPAVFKKAKFERGSEIFDYGCGKYIKHIKDFVENDLGCTYYWYDKYNKNHDPLPSENIPDHVVDYAVCSNVINTIDDLDTVKEVIDAVCSSADTAYFYIHDGDRSGVGRQTGNDKWQRNAKSEWYLDLMREMGYKPTIKYGVITVK